MNVGKSVPEIPIKGQGLSISADDQGEQGREDQTLITLYALAGEESEGFTLRPRFFRRIGRVFFPEGAAEPTVQVVRSLQVRELSAPEMAQVERELWVHYHQQKANPDTDRLFAAFAGKRLIGVARCSRHRDGLEVDAVFVLDEFRRRGFARSVMQLLIGECGQDETLYMHAKIELIDFYASLGFRIIPEEDLPVTIRDRFSFCLGDLKGIDVCPMKRDPPAGVISAGD
ncbi:MAG TPA: GNAT family N-acetyltransferase [Methanoregulaceae archaeon]|nr:GNAT family N-acetyltransferase [Methanoregulaceae archaeon]